MAPRERRPTTAQAARIGVLALANALALVLLWRVFSRSEAEPNVPARAVSEATQGPPATTGPAAETAAEKAETAAAPAALSLAQQVAAIVRRCSAQAVGLGQGAFTRDDVQVSVHIRSAHAKEPMVDIAPHASLLPASNMKLVTTAAALCLFGIGGHFETCFEAGGPIEDGVLNGDLIVRAGGDPLFTPEEAGRCEELIRPVLLQLQDAGLAEVAGELVLDEGSFPTPSPGPSWPDERQHWAEYCALSGGFSANAGCLTARVFPRTAGSPAEVRVEPSAHGLLERLSVETSRQGPLSVRVGVAGSLVRVEGSIPEGSRVYSARFAHPDPVELFGEVLRAELRRAGISVRGVRRQRGAPIGREIARLRTPIAGILGAINSESMNALADQLFLATGLVHGGEGTRKGGAVATRAALERLGVDCEGLVQVDGSGLSRENRVRASQLVALLQAVALAPDLWGPFRASLAVAGESGTLRDRMAGGPAAGRILGKSGWIAGASALSGVALAQDGQGYCFCILVNYPNIDGLNTRCFKPMQDEICTLLVSGASP
jgi:D-alanyl-D-alanine carboxypeptidase/D-alanyl-D-alanine-endopeptidase (penicillin-binding protein 4)